MKLSKLCITAALAGGLLAAAYADQPKDVATFVNTANCPSCDLSSAGLMKLMNTKIASAGSNFYQKANLQGANIIRSNLSFINGSLEELNFDNAVGTEAYLVNDELVGSTFVNGIFEGTNFRHSDLSYCDFTGTDLKGSSFQSANLYGAKLTAAQLAEVNLCNATMPDGSKHGC